MVSAEGLYGDVSGAREALLLGLASIPFTVAINGLWVSGTVRGEALVAACVLSGYRYGSKSLSGSRTGALTGLAGGIPLAIYWARENWVALVVWSGDPLLSWVGAVGFTAIFGTATLLVVGVSAGFVGEWMRDRIKASGSRSSSA